MRPIALELTTVAAVDEAVVDPAGAFHHQRLLDQLGHQAAGLRTGSRVLRDVSGDRIVVAGELGVALLAIEQVADPGR